MNKKSVLFNQLIKRITASCFILMLAVILFVPAGVSSATGDPIGGGQDLQVALDEVGSQTVLKKTDPIQIIGGIIKVALGFLGAIAIILVMYGGWLYMTSGGEAQKVEKAKKVLIDAFIGLAIILSAYAITSFIFKMLAGDSGGKIPTSYYGTAGLPGGGFGISGGAFGEIIQSHYPMPEQNQVPRNTMILVTFKEAIDKNSVINFDDKTLCPTGAPQNVLDNCGTLRDDAFRVFDCKYMVEANKGEGSTDACTSVPFADLEDDANLISPNGYALITEDERTIIFDPYGTSKSEHLGSPEFDVSYIVYLTSDIKKKSDNNQTIFSDTNPDYKWRFTTGTFLDLTPPKILAVVPADVDYPVAKADLKGCSCPKIGCSNTDCDGFVYLNQGVYIHFNEPVIPPLTQTPDCEKAGDDDNEVQMLNIEPVAGCTSNHVPGAWKVGINQYRSVQFMSGTECKDGALNSCGEPAYCLPEDSTLTGKVLAAMILDGGVGLAGTGIMDMGGNSLDGNKNGKADGPGDIDAPLDDKTNWKDNYYWDFKTGFTLDLIGPTLLSLEPDNKTPNIDLQMLLKSNFSEGLDAYSVDTEASIEGMDGAGQAFNSWYDPNLGQKTDDTQDPAVPTVDDKQIAISHGPFAEYNELLDEKSSIYTPVLRSEIKDTRFNCFSPSKEFEAGKVTDSTCSEISAPGQSCCPQDGDFKLNKTVSEFCEVPDSQ